MRKIPADLVQQYEAEGWWAPGTLGDLLARGLAAAPGPTFRVHSEVRPWAGTFRDVERIARRLAGGLRARSGSRRTGARSSPRRRWATSSGW